MKFIIEEARSINQGYEGIPRETIISLFNKGLSVREISADELFMTTVDIFNLDDLFTLLRSVGKCVINLTPGPDLLPVITIYNDIIE